jgi:excisionase family DNA binding protein
MYERGNTILVQEIRQESQADFAEATAGCQAGCEAGSKGMKREPRTRPNLVRYLADTVDFLDCLIKYGEPSCHDPCEPEADRQFFTDYVVGDKMQEAARVCARFGHEVAETSDPVIALMAVGQLLDQLKQRPDSLLTVRDVASQLRVNQSKILGWIAYNRLRAVNMAKGALGRPRWRIRPADLDEFLAGRRHP